MHVSYIGLVSAIVLEIFHSRAYLNTIQSYCPGTSRCSSIVFLHEGYTPKAAVIIKNGIHAHLGV
jgi:hypothetical protein